MSRIYLLRHGQAEHLEEDWKHKVTGTQYVKRIRQWELSRLTPKGVELVKQLKPSWPKGCPVFCSPMLRAYQTAKLVFGNSPFTVHPLLTEAFVTPFRFLLGLKLSISMWMMVTVVTSFANFSFHKLFCQADTMLEKAQQTNSDVVFVSHNARIRIITFWAHWRRGWRVVKKDLSPLGLTILEKR